MDIKERIKILRKDILKLTQTDFGNRIGVAKSTIAGYELGTRRPIDRAINSICREFNVSHAWLTEGIGDPFIQSDDDDIIELINKALSNENEFIRNVFKSFAKLDTKHWEALEEFMKISLGIDEKKQENKK
ncbi:helix-turn-helix domain-containing protein [Clostridium septicum]|nr:helix-turn-helix transcriptional regulator [Clostridium septicum]UEC19660.1 helix-turn-helix domain-containing protein [Clostridium septicum]USS02279.1 helix-turn-helix domain-containing protein [Clostridium septicum]WLF70862.1 helix-turn-helix transcriptional regulator [Clostridium septicum]